MVVDFDQIYIAPIKPAIEQRRLEALRGDEELRLISFSPTLPAANHLGCGSLRHEMGIVANGLDAQ